MSKLGKAILMQVQGATLHNGRGDMFQLSALCLSADTVADISLRLRVSYFAVQDHCDKLGVWILP